MTVVSLVILVLSPVTIFPQNETLLQCGNMVVTLPVHVL